MAATHYKLLFKGGVRAGHDESALKQKLGELLKLDASGLAQLFSGRLITLKRGLPQAEASKYQQVLESIGAEVLLQQEDCGSVVDTPPSTPVKPADKAAEEMRCAEEGLVCPRCGYQQALEEQCVHCKMDLRRHIIRLQRKAKAQQLRSATDGRTATG